MWGRNITWIGSGDVWGIAGHGYSVSLNPTPETLILAQAYYRSLGFLIMLMLQKGLGFRG